MIYERHNIVQLAKLHNEDNILSTETSFDKRKQNILDLLSPNGTVTKRLCRFAKVLSTF